MAYEAKNYDSLKGGKLKGLTDAQLDAHFTLYKGYITKLNEIEEKLATIDNSKANYSFNEYSELKRREAVAFNGSFLHELYFENLGADSEINAGLAKALEAAGGKDKVVADLKAAAMCGPGWAVLTRNRRDNKLHTYFFAEHLLLRRAPPGPPHRAGPARGAGQLGARLHDRLRHRPREVPRGLRREHQVERGLQALRRLRPSRH